MIPASALTVYDAFAQAARMWPERDCLNVLPSTASVYAIESGAQRYADLHSEIITLSQQFEQAGFAQGMRVALLLENRPIYFATWLALNRLGLSVVPINPDLRLSELTYLIAHSEPALIIAIESRHKELRSAAAAAKITLNVIEPGSPLPAPRKDAVVAELSDGELCEDREAAVLYTSGTTGNPKGCVLPNTYFLLAGNWYASVGGLATLTTDGERMITPLPIFHMNAMAYSFMAMVATGGCLTVLDRFHPKQWWSDVVESRATCLHYLGVMPSMLMGADPSTEETQHHVRFGFGAGIDPQLHATFEQRFGFPLVEAWAMTETGAGAVVAASDPERLIGQSCLGRPAEAVECKLIDDQGNKVQPEQRGELLVRHRGENPRYGFFTRYYKDDKATEQAWEAGWFHTGDIVRQDHDGNLFFVDRKKNVIRRSGENIAAVEVESVLMKHPAISAAAVTAVPDTVRGDEVFACLKVAIPSTELAVEITRWCLTQMAYYKAPGYIAFVDSLPLTATQKVQRSELNKLALSLLDDTATTNTTHYKKRQLAS